MQLWLRSPPRRWYSDCSENWPDNRGNLSETLESCVLSYSIGFKDVLNLRSARLFPSVELRAHPTRPWWRDKKRIKEDPRSQQERFGNHSQTHKYNTSHEIGGWEDPCGTCDGNLPYFLRRLNWMMWAMCWKTSCLGEVSCLNRAQILLALHLADSCTLFSRILSNTKSSLVRFAFRCDVSCLHKYGSNLTILEGRIHGERRLKVHEHI